jgi:hypothetical protein
VGFSLYAVLLLVQLARAWRELRAGRSVDASPLGSSS